MLVKKIFVECKHMPKRKLPPALKKFKSARDKALKAGKRSFTYTSMDGVKRTYKRHTLKSGLVTYKRA